MDLDQIAYPSEDKPRKQFFKGSGFWWFLETSWHYVNPRGMREGMQFVLSFPSAWRGYRKIMDDNK